jgi:hypothetical protein
MSQAEPDDWIKRLTETYRGIRFAKGVVGKTGYAMIAVCGIWGIIVWRLGNELAANLALLGAGVLITGVFIWWVKSTQGFAERNPAQAMLDGAEFLEYRKFEAQAKGVNLPKDVPKLPDPTRPPPPLIELPVRPEEGWQSICTSRSTLRVGKLRQRSSMSFSIPRSTG